MDQRQSLKLIQREQPVVQGQGDEGLGKAGDDGRGPQFVEKVGARRPVEEAEQAEDGERGAAAGFPSS